ncbi:hypothetical protein Fmac_026384 [Flemingia macrophylla]|uniref:Uncharacterized protein n=1 Tax=Flemingia macrophylla TaxID=520843 RepID=A0ABD1LEQ2_9FABA
MKITLLSLIMSFELHPQTLLKGLIRAYVTPSISQDKFKGIISHIVENNHLTFTDEEIPLGGTDHNKPLHIYVKYREYLIVKALVDNRHSLNDAMDPQCQSCTLNALPESQVCGE